MSRTINTGIAAAFVSAALATTASAQAKIDLNKTDFNNPKSWVVQDQPEFKSETKPSLIYPDIPAFGNLPLGRKPTVVFGAEHKFRNDINLSLHYEFETDGLARFKSSPTPKAGEMQVRKEKGFKGTLAFPF